MPIPGQESFAGHEQDLEEFLRLARSPIRSPERTPALQRWREYKQRRLYEICSQRGKVLRKGWNMGALREHLIDLSGAQLNGICLGYVDLRGVKLDGASLRGAWLKGAEMEHASLRNADLSELGPTPPSLDNAAGSGPARLVNADLSRADLTGANLAGVDLSGCNLVGATLDGATLSGSRVYGISAWDISLCDDNSKRRDLVITHEADADVRVDDIEIAQFVYLLLNRKKLRNVINAVTERGVLILGRFADGGLETLRAIADAVRDADHLPMLFDFDRPDDRDYTETVQTLAGLSRFVIVELSGPSVPQELMATVPKFEIPFIPILAKGRRPHSMFRDLTKYSWVHPEVLFYEAGSRPAELFRRIVEPAERILERKRDRLARY